MFENLGLRDELFHPAVSHFPIVLTTLVFFSAIAKLALYKKSQQKYHDIAHAIGVVCLYLCVPFYLISLFLGELAFEIVKSDLCQIVAALKHEEQAELGLILIIFTIASDSINRLVKHKKIRFFNMIIFYLLISANMFQILKTSHSGALLVYDQGAAVKNVVTKCEH